MSRPVEFAAVSCGESVRGILQDKILTIIHTAFGSMDSFNADVRKIMRRIAGLSTDRLLDCKPSAPTAFAHGPAIGYSRGLLQLLSIGRAATA